MSRTIYFAAVSYDFGQCEREDFADEREREQWIAKRVRGDVYEGAKVISVARAEGEWVDAAAPPSHGDVT